MDSPDQLTGGQRARTDDDEGGKFRLDRGPLRWWLIATGIVATDFELWRYAAGSLLVVAGAGLHLFCKFYLRQGVEFLRRTGRLTTAGPYRFTRNPFYLGSFLAEMGMLIIIGRMPIALVYLFSWAWVYREQIFEEEAKLERVCSAEFRRYCSRVPRLFPRPWKFIAASKADGPQFSWSNPNIVGGRELERAIRLATYPLLLFAAGCVRQRAGDGLAALYSAFVALAAFLLANIYGRFTTYLLDKRAEKEKSPRPASLDEHRLAA